MVSENSGKDIVPNSNDGNILTLMEFSDLRCDPSE